MITIVRVSEQIVHFQLEHRNQTLIYLTHSENTNNSNNKAKSFTMARRLPLRKKSCL